MIKYLTKSELYLIVKQMKLNMGYKYDDYKLNLYNYCINCPSILIEKIYFQTPSLKGMAIIETGKKDIILLNDKLNKYELNFYCGHELFHLYNHNYTNIKTFNCFEYVKNQQNPYLEWQANEGSAEIIMPYKEFIPKLADLLSSTNMSYNKLKKIMANEFNVTESMIWCRIENLKYEFYQYYKLNKNINELEILSKTELNKRNIDIKSINDTFGPHIFNL